MRQQTCTTVTLRQRPIRNGRISLYLDYYPAVRNPKTMKLSRREYLGFYIYATPKNAIELDYNNEILAKAELIRCRRQEAVINEEFGFMDRHKMRADFMHILKKYVVRKIINGISFICTLRNLSMANVCLEKSLLTYVTASETIFSMQGN